MNKDIFIIGNNNNRQVVSDGGRIKLRLFAKLLSKNNNVAIIDLFGWKYRFLIIVHQIKKAIKKRATIVIMAGPSGCRFIIPLVNKLNKKKKAKTVFCALGIGTIDKLICDMPVENANNFLNCETFYDISDSNMKKHLSNLDYVVLENEKLNKLYKEFYGLNNTIVLQNIRDIEIKERCYRTNGDFRIIYFGRINVEKGVLDLIDVLKDINMNNKFAFKLDLYGDNQLSSDEDAYFKAQLDSNIDYKGIVNNNEVENVFENYDLFCLPTKYHGEGSSGSLIEAMISGIPCLISSYSQSSVFIDDGVDGFVFAINSKESLKEKLISAYEKRDILPTIGRKAQEKSKKYTYSANSHLFDVIF